MKISKKLTAFIMQIMVLVLLCGSASYAAPILPKAVNSVVMTYTTNVGNTIKLSGTTVNKDKNKIKWTTADPEVATVDSQGLVKTKNEGSTYITATSGSTSKKWAVKAIGKISEYTFTINEGENHKLEVVDSRYPLSWTSSNEDVAIVDANGNVQAIGEGEAFIEATNSIYTYECKVNVEKAVTNEKVEANLENNQEVKPDEKTECNHKFSREVVLEATCTEKGKAQFKCSECGYEYDEEIDAIGHKYDNTSVSKATCTEDGYDKISCSLCGDEKIENRTSKTGHRMIVDSDSTTCEKDGQEVKRCIYCTYTETTDKKAPGHDPVEVERIEATCTGNGKIVSRCKNCKSDIIEVIESKGHNYILQETVAPTCTEDGYDILKCSKCGDIKNEYPATDEYKAKGHSVNRRLGYVNVRPTCTEVGETEYICTVPGCDYSELKVVMPLGHRYSDYVIDKEPTCEDFGTKHATCKNCGKEVEAKIQPLGHDISEAGEVVAAARCTEDGEIRYTCSRCDYSYSESIPATGHDISENTTAPTCTSDGVTNRKCRNCDFSEEIVVPSEGHNYEDLDEDNLECTVCGNKVYTGCDNGHNYSGEITTEATCTEDGVITYTCTKCGDSYTSAIDALGHDQTSAYTVEKEANCESNGKKVKNCSRCGELLDEETIQKTEHDYNLVIVKEATVKEAGLQVLKCTICGVEKDSQEIPALTCKHSNYYWEVVREATCSKTKIKKATCKDCGTVLIANYDTKTLDGDVHENLKETVVYDATTTATGLKKIACEDCGYAYTETIPMIICKHTRTGLSVDGEGNWWSICSDCGIILGPSSYNKANCKHEGYGRTRHLVQRVGENQEGIWNYTCNNCQQVVSTTTYPGYQVYTIDTGNGTTAEIYGYYITDMPQSVWEMTNAYRSANGLNTLNYASGIQNECDIRARESAYKFDHERPNGQRWYELNRSKMNGENLAMGYNTAGTVMTAWKNSPGHNENLLYPTFKSLAVSTFVKYNLSSGEGFPSRTYCTAQTFSCYAQP